MQRLPLQHIFFFRLHERLYRDLYFDYIFIGNERQSDGINGKPRVNYSPEALVIYLASIRYHLQKAFRINNSQSQPFCLVTEREGTVRYKDKTAVWAGRPIPYELDQPFIVSSGRCLPTKELKKRCCTGLTCQYNNTKS